MKKHLRKAAPLLLTLTALLLLILFVKQATREDLHIVNYTVKGSGLTDSVRLVMLSDLHGSTYGKSQEQLLREIETLSPHAVLLVGDIFDEYTDHGAAKDLLAGLSGKYPCYYVSGNHEYTADFEEIRAILSEYDVTCLWGEGDTVTLNGQRIFLAGLADKNHALYYRTPALPIPEEQLLEIEKTKPSTDLFSLLLCHRPHPQLFENSGYDLVLSGHNHGGQVRFPGLVNGLFAPGEGFFPKYAGGRYELAGKTTLIVGRGLAKTAIPRVFNRPEIVYIELLPDAEQQ